MQWWAARILKRFPGHHGNFLIVYKGSDMPPECINALEVRVGERYIQEHYPIAYARFLTQLMAMGTHKWHTEGSLRCNVWQDPVLIAHYAATDLATKKRMERINELIQAKGIAIKGPKKVRDEK